jgi:hypothetical protein
MVNCSTDQDEEDEEDPTVKPSHRLLIKVPGFRIRIPTMDPQYFSKLDPDLHKSQISEALEAQNRAVEGLRCLQWRPGGSVDPWDVESDHFDKELDPGPDQH